jgi:hypothetical protein
METTSPYADRPIECCAKEFSKRLEELVKRLLSMFVFAAVTQSIGASPISVDLSGLRSGRFPLK